MNDDINTAMQSYFDQFGEYPSLMMLPDIDAAEVLARIQTSLDSGVALEYPELPSGAMV